MEKVSEMLIAVGGHLLETPDSQPEMQARLDIVKHAWNLSLMPEAEAKHELNTFLKSQEPYAPDKETLLELEWEYRRIIKRRLALYPDVAKKVIRAVAIETGKNDYTIRAFFAP